jgi:hypothetical protein
VIEYAATHRRRWVLNDSTALGQALPTDDERWAQWLAMGGENFTGSNFGTLFYDDEGSGTLSLYFTFGRGAESAVDMLIISSEDAGTSNRLRSYSCSRSQCLHGM